MKEQINKLLVAFAKLIDKSRILLILKVFVFCSVVVTAIMMYRIGSIAWGNDLLLTAGILIALNKLDMI